MIHKITNNSFDEVEKADLALVDFSATWCGPCRMLAPVLEELSEEMKDKVTFWGVDVDENMGLAQKFNIVSIPALVLLKNGVKVDERVGFRPKEELKVWIESQF